MNKALPILLAAVALVPTVAPRVSVRRDRRGAESIDEILARARADRGKPAVDLEEIFGQHGMKKPLLLRAAP